MVKADPSLHMHIRQFQIVGRGEVTEKTPHPKVFRMTLFAKDAVTAKSKFWYFMNRMKKLKKTTGEVLAVNEMHEKNSRTIKNFGIWLRYNSRTGTHNMYKEYRDLTLVGAVGRMYSEMASRHRARQTTIQIIRTAVVPAALCRRSNTTQFHNSKIRFPLIRRLPRAPTKALKTTFKAVRPTTFLH
eukprot:c19918_g1_i2.p1 GENE.c19918_g1_i2~~c19918_g1_i2.p1  ORF type:complete len:186 (-),score=-76.68 c19918_g1_i2:157-714(-)